MRVVLDANIFISALISSQGNPAKILEKWQKRELEVVVSSAIVDEIERVTGYERLQKKYRRIREEREGLIDDLRNFATMVEPQQKLSVVQADDSDNRYIECAIESGASYIVTGDPHLLDIGEYQGIPILTPAIFVALLENT
ncbi:putative toxin-antitoxin system toxin component, PIN family [Candidatus Leptofilum sp.]|uniref:putative toxin-antitoxin system toxin component, PIN family n=1 Tax=Candidatus Leptofilum sp. TaxID=3241576 RepID=UPI003B58D0F6